MKGVVLLSGGMDSIVTLAIALQECEEVRALIFDYGQRNAYEVMAAHAVATHYIVEATLVNARFFRTWGASALTDAAIEVPTVNRRGKGVREDLSKQVQPLTYVPARNLVFLAIAASAAEAWGFDQIYYGANHLDSSGYPDCTPKFVEAMHKVICEGTYHPLTLLAPLMTMTKADIVRRGEELGVPWHLTWSCYKGGTVPCGLCDSCRLRAKGFKGAEVTDPLLEHIAYG